VAQRPEFKDYPGNNLPPKSIISEAGGKYRFLASTKILG
jgi:hypothetical protein